MKLIKGKETEKTWQEKFQAQAIRYADKVIENFNSGMAFGENLLPDRKDVHQRAEVLNIMMDSLIGSLTVLATTYGNCFQQQEEAIIAGLRAHFKAMRATQLGMDGEQVEVPVQPPQERH